MDTTKTKPKFPNFLSTRFSPSVATSNPRPLKYYQMQSDEKGNVKFVETEPVAPSMADDFSINTNAMLNRTGFASYRINTDVTEIDEQLSKLI